MGGGVFTLSIVILNIHHINDIKYEIESYDNIPSSHNELPRATTFYTPLPKYRSIIHIIFFA